MVWMAAMATLIESLGDEINQIAAAYESAFAGQSRASRNLDELDSLIRRVRSVLGRVDQIPSAARGADLASLREVAAGNLRIYESEREAIKAAKASGPDFEVFARLATTANFVFARYHRHFAGKDRMTRDLGLLAEMVEDLKQLRQRMAAVAAKNAKNPSANFSRDVDLVGQNLEMYQGEIKAIADAQGMGTPEEQAGVLANLANDQFQIYRLHFAGQSRTTRRPALLQRVVDNLRRYRDRMAALRDGGLTVDFNGKNIEVVDGNLALYETELGEIRKARQQTAMGDIMGMLGASANELFEEYRKDFAGKSRGQVNQEQLGAMADKLGEIHRQMTDLGRAEENEMNERNLDVVQDQLAMFEREWEQVQALKAGQAPAGDAGV